MGIFDFLKPKEKFDNLDVQKQKLATLEINPYDFSHEHLEPAEISLVEEVEGAVKVSEITLEDGDAQFDYISLTDNSNGTKSLYLAQVNREERAIKILVDKFYDVLGESRFGHGTFTKYDIMAMKENTSGQMREWDLPNFTVVVGFNNEQRSSNYVMVDEKVL